MPDPFDSIPLGEDLDTAIAACEASLRANPGNAKLHAQMGLFLFRKGQGEAAAIEFRKAAVLDEYFYALSVDVLKCYNKLITAELQRLQLQANAVGSRMPSPPYQNTISWIHAALSPKTYVEIGVHAGESLILASTDTRAIGIDPSPLMKEAPSKNTSIVQLTSDDYFAQRDLAQDLGAPTFDLAFIDGLHLWEQALKDFMNLEQFARPDSVIMLHDCIPFDELTSQRIRDSLFYSGDVWKLTSCLKRERPDLRMVMIPAPPTGLCLVTALNPNDRSLSEKYDDLLAEWTPLGYSSYNAHPEWMPESIQNTPGAVRSWINESKSS